MIFVTVGSMLPFDRLISALDVWSRDLDLLDVFAQTGAGAYAPSHMRWVRSLTPIEFNQKMAEATLIVAHAGMGTIISAMELGKPIVIMPRRAADREVTTDHQLHSANWLRDKPGVYVAMAEHELPGVLSKAMKNLAQGTEEISRAAPPEFVARIREFLAD